MLLAHWGEYKCY